MGTWSATAPDGPPPLPVVEKAKGVTGPAAAASKIATTRRASSTVEMNGMRRRSNRTAGKLNQQRVAHCLGRDARAVREEEDRHGQRIRRRLEACIVLRPPAITSDGQHTSAFIEPTGPQAIPA